MNVLGKPIGNIVDSDIRYLKDNKVQESLLLDYKRDLPGNSDGDKKEFLADISSFANTLGGIIIFGILEEKDDEGKNTGVPQDIVGLGEINLDQESQRLESIVREGLDPRMSGVVIRSVVVDGKTTLLIGIPRSLQAPHMLAFKRDGKFYSHNNSGKFQMDAREIKQAFLQTDEFEKMAERFRRTRIAEVRSLQFLPTLDTTFSYFIQAFPLGYRRGDVDFRKYSHDLPLLLEPPRSAGWSNRFNLEGFIVAPQTNPCPSYIQYFRNGGLEVYTAAFMKKQDQNGVRPLLAGLCEKLAISYLQKYFSFAQKFPLEPPVVVYLSFLGVQGASMGGPHGYDFDMVNVNRFDRDEILLPPIVLDDLGSDLPKLFRPIFDMLWQSAGWPGSPYFKGDVWSPPG